MLRFFIDKIPLFFDEYDTADRIVLIPGGKNNRWIARLEGRGLSERRVQPGISDERPRFGRETSPPALCRWNGDY
ncbi:hypothetical protein JW916_01555, partial [Candidatus Sumerlaeota bacterium]|nr:hypothetical protein [Candidatus Sumerlaeota bacterium]